MGLLLSAAVSPVVPACWYDNVGNVAIDEDGSGVWSPRTAQVDGASACDAAVDKHEACGLVAGPLLGCQRPSIGVGYGVQRAALQQSQKVKRSIAVNITITKEKVRLLELIVEIWLY